MEGRSPINIFDINNQQPKKNQYNIFNGGTTNVGGSSINYNQYTQEMETLDNELKEQ